MIDILFTTSSLYTVIPIHAYYEANLHANDDAYDNQSVAFTGCVSDDSDDATDTTTDTTDNTGTMELVTEL